MSLPPAFLDEIRARVALAGVIARRTRLVKKGREWSGLCPFHNEKSPSFTVNEDKGFFHCFGCGAHGDVIGFVMRAENRSFIEAIETLAAEAGLEVPKPTPEARERAQQQQTLYEVVEAAAQFFQSQLQLPAGSAARAYLERRGLDDAAIERFRLGYAPAGQGLLKQHLLRDFPEALIKEAGLIGQREGSTVSFDYFRDRVMFPILDRRGRPIAFGGRVMGDAKPKYLNSPDTPIFHKGTVLYGLSWAREGVGKGADLIVTEGYMDVIALQRGGFAGAVAPLGTALTEDQLDLLWQMAPEPILCFDGDAAGQRAAGRALERALPTLKAGRSLRFAVLPEGEDPDTLIARFGPGIMQERLRQARPLAEFLWTIELAARPVDTPERRADLSGRLMARAALISDETLRREYQSFFRNCLFERLRPKRTRERGKFRMVPALTLPPPPDPAMMMRRRQETLLSVMLRHPEILGEMIEDFAAVAIRAPDLDRLRAEIINVYTSHPGLDAAALNHHLSSHGHARDIEALSSRSVLEHARFALSTDRDVIEAGVRQLFAFLQDDVDVGREQERVARRADLDLEGIAAHVDALHAEIRQRRRDEAELDLPATERQSTRG
jgi:DNA primase